MNLAPEYFLPVSVALCVVSTSSRFRTHADVGISVLEKPSFLPFFFLTPRTMHQVARPEWWAPL